MILSILTSDIVDINSFPVYESILGYSCLH